MLTLLNEGSFGPCPELIVFLGEIGEYGKDIPVRPGLDGGQM